MSLADVVVTALHLTFAAGWVGSVLFMTLVVLPLARDGKVNATPLERLTAKLTRWSRVSALVMLATGAHMTASGYADILFDTTAGHLVLGMIVLWLAFTGLVEVGSSRMADDLAQKKVRAPARDNLVFYRVASAVGVLLFLVAAAIVTGI